MPVQYYKNEPEKTQRSLSFGTALSNPLMALTKCNLFYCQHVITGKESKLAADGIFIFIGHHPNTQLFAGQLEMSPGAYIVTDTNMMTNIPGVFAAGEVADPVYRQVITSAGMGAAASIQAAKYLEEME